MIEVCAAVVVRAATVLVARRRRPVDLAGKWEFPGGKLEPGETPQECLVRELREELAFGVTVGDALGTSEQNPPGTGDTHLRLTAYAARPVAEGVEPRLADGTHDQIRWVTAEQLPAVDLAPLDVPLLEGALRLLDAPHAHFH